MRQLRIVVTKASWDALEARAEAAEQALAEVNAVGLKYAAEAKDLRAKLAAAEETQDSALERLGERIGECAHLQAKLAAAEASIQNIIDTTVSEKVYEKTTNRYMAETDAAQAQVEKYRERSLMNAKATDAALARVRELESHNCYAKRVEARVAALTEALREMLHTFVPKDAYNEKAQAVIAHARKVLSNSQGVL